MIQMILTTIGVIVASLWDGIETKRGILQGRIREGNFLLKSGAGLASTRKMFVTGIPIGAGWLIWFTGWHGLAVGLLAALAGVFCLFAWFGRKAGR